MKTVDGSDNISGQNLWTLTNYKGLDPESYSKTGASEEL